jgi:hypothetical protein
MATFTITRKLDLPSEKVWATVSDFTSGVLLNDWKLWMHQIPSLIGCYLEHLLKNISALLMLLPKMAQH